MIKIKPVKTLSQQFRLRAYQRLLEPKSTDYLNHRRELLVNIFLCSVTIISLLAIITASIHNITSSDKSEPSSFISNVLFATISGICWYASRRGKFIFASRAIVLLLSAATIYMTILYSYELPIVAPLYALSVVVTGILLTTRGALATSFLLSLGMFVIGYLQVIQYLHPYVSWHKTGFQIGDVVGVVAILSLIGIITWLANREIDHAIDQSLIARQALVVERDSLEQNVLDRTRDLEQSQLLRVMQLQRFAEFGQLNAHLLHDIANPLTAASINIEQARARQPRALKMAQANIKHLERYVAAARQQLQLESVIQAFSANAELRKLRPLLSPIAKSKKVTLIYDVSPKLQLYGSPVKFNQLLGNIIVNAIDAYDDMPKSSSGNRVLVRIQRKNNQLKLTVTDYGGGITPNQLGRVYEPFYTTKGAGSRGMGIGLSMVKQYVEQDFHGSIVASSNPSSGTIFTVIIPLLG